LRRSEKTQSAVLAPKNSAFIIVLPGPPLPPEKLSSYHCFTRPGPLPRKTHFEESLLLEIESSHAGCVRPQERRE
jgi:hypothetical protein